MSEIKLKQRIERLEKIVKELQEEVRAARSESAAIANQNRRYGPVKTDNFVNPADYHNIMDDPSLSVTTKRGF